MRRPSGSFRPSYVGFGAPVASRRTCFGAYSDRREHLFCRAAARSLRLGAGGPSPPGRTGNAYERNRLRLRNAIAERRTSRRRRPGVFRTVRASVFRTPHRTFPARSLRRYASARARERIRFTARTAAAETDSERSAAGRTETARSGCPKIPYHDVSQRSPVLLPTAVVYHSDPCRPGACFCMSPPPGRPLPDTLPSFGPAPWETGGDGSGTCGRRQGSECCWRTKSMRRIFRCGSPAPRLFRHTPRDSSPAARTARVSCGTSSVSCGGEPSASPAMPSPLQKNGPSERPQHGRCSLRPCCFGTAAHEAATCIPPGSMSSGPPRADASAAEMPDRRPASRRSAPPSYSAFSIL